MSVRFALATLLLATLVLPMVSSQAGDSAVTLGLSLRIDQSAARAGTGQLIEFNSTITNPAATNSTPLLVFLSIVDRQQGAPMDLEDWTSKRSEAVAPLAPGGSATQTWTIRAIIQGDYVIHVIALPNASSSTGSPLWASGPLEMHVTQRTNLNPAGVMPTLVAVPAAILIAFGLTQRARRNQVAIPKKERPTP